MDANEARDQLVAEQDRLGEVLEQMDASHLKNETETESAGELSSYAQHSADLGTETFEREKDLSILESVEAELADVEHALKRLDEGTYGTCEACNQPISDERLAAMPATRFCLEDQSRAEHESRLSSVADSHSD